ncbi:uncharacterized protein At4g38062-like [Olea europaea var. sylvestris]|uniref:uncharacterized protein At4g38062-like n=1 Tax=Olea europaea var. sylvestris TaxID=158386 RepID=UPI000C1D84E3|nr:uncharacterized protein At4g38062-like [Olea europaea var. sylvestris]XP_022896900.1 uncharacterized protein At4g38062-like [Olea europaea var. sylvestris]
MELDRVYDELDGVKVEVKKLREECRAKADLTDRLRKAHIEQLAKFQEAKTEVERQGRELNAKSEEICEIRQLYEKLNSSLHQKDLYLQRLTFANENLRVGHGEKILKLEGENRDLVLALDKASARIQDLERKICRSGEEISGVERLSSVKPQKRVMSKYLKEREEYILKLEEECRIAQDQLKWKNEQFLHLEEAHRKLQDQVQAGKVELEQEKSAFLQEIGSLRAGLDSQILVSESLETQLRMSNQVLVLEKDARKALETEVSECRSSFENVFLECQKAKLKIEQLTSKRDEEIGELHNLLRAKETLYGEMKYRTARLEQENKELLGSVEQIQEAQLYNIALSSSLKKLQHKLQNLEQLHSICAINLKEKEAEWSNQIEKLTGDLKCCISKSDGKSKKIRELSKELEDCHRMLEVQNEENYILILVLKSEFDVSCLKLHDENAKLKLCIKRSEEKDMVLSQQLQEKKGELHKVYANMKQRYNEIAVLLEKVESLDFLKQKVNLLEKKIGKHKDILDELSECQYRFDEQVLHMENTLTEQGRYACDALELVNTELAKKTGEVEKNEIEMQKLQSVAENLKLELHVDQEAHKQDNVSLLGIVNDKDAQIDNLQEQIRILELEIIAKTEAAETLKQEKDNYLQIEEDRNCIIESLQKEIARLEQGLAESAVEPLAGLDGHKALEQKQETVSLIIKETDQSIQNLQKRAESLEENFRNTMISFAEKGNKFDEDLRIADDQKILEIEERNKITDNLQKEANYLRQKLEFQEKIFIDSKQEALQLEVLLQEKKSETEELKAQLGDEQERLEVLINDLKSHKETLLEVIMRASVDREGLLAQMEEIYGQIGAFCCKDVELMGMLGKMMQLSEENSVPAMNVEITFSPSRKAVEEYINKRTPLSERNNY